MGEVVEVGVSVDSERSSDVEDDGCSLELSLREVGTIVSC